MKLALKVTLAVVLGIVVVLSVFTYLRVQGLIALFDEDMRKNHVLIGSTLAVPVLDVWFTDGPSRASEVVRLANADRHGTYIGWLPRQGLEPPGSSALVDWQQMSEVEHRVQQLSGAAPNLEASPQGKRYLVTHVPVVGQRGLIGALELATSFDARDRYIRTSVLNSVLTALVMSVVAAALVLALGVVLIGRPIARLTDMARRVSAAEPGEPLELRQNDEVGFLAAEMNAMCERLAAANATAAAEAAGRIRLEGELRHAERLITVGKLAAGIAHELGTPLNIVAGRARMIVRGKVEEHAIVEYARSIADQADRMTTIIQQLLDYSRRREPHKLDVNLTTATSACVDLLRQMAARKGVDLVLDTSDDVRALADPNQIDQVTTNLVVNALQASPRGSTVKISTGVSETPRGSESAGEAQPFAFVRIADQGTGMSNDVMQRVFEPFYTTKATGQGVGLGLSVVSGIVEEHGGWIKVESELGRGSVFSVYLPQG